MSSRPLSDFSARRMLSQSLTAGLLAAVFSVAFFVVVAGPTCAHAAEAAGPAIVSAEVGIAGVVKLGHWTPVRIAVKAGSEPLRGRLDLRTVDGDGVDVVYRGGTQQQVVCGPGETVERFAYFQCGRRYSVLEILLQPAGVASRTANARAANAGAGQGSAPPTPPPAPSTARRTSEKPLASLKQEVGKHEQILLSTQEWFLQVGAPLDLKPMLRQMKRTTAAAPVTRQVEDLTKLPTHWWGYAAVDQLVVTTSVEGGLEALRPPQREALLQWLRMGGRLFLCAGRRAEAFFAKAELQMLAPGKFARLVRQRQAPGLENYARATERLGSFEVALFQEPRGARIAVEQSVTREERPLILRYPFGFGVVTYCAVDLDQEPFRNWSSQRTLLASVLTSTAGRETPANRQRVGRVTHIGYEDLAGQLRSALDQFQSAGGGVQRMTFYAIAGMIALYLLLIGPADYFLQRKVIGRMEWTWLTFPAVVICFCLIAAALFRRYKGHETRINRIELVDFDAETGSLRGRSCGNLYSPRTESFNVSLQPGWEFPVETKSAATASESGDGGASLGWLGLPGNGLGGLNTLSRAASFPAPYTIVPAGGGDATATVQRLPIQVASSKSLTAQWWASRTPDNSARLRVRGEFLTGELTNPFPVELVDCHLLHGDWTYRLDRRLLPNETISISELNEPRDLVWRLTRRRVVSDKTTYASTPWDPQDADVERIMEMLMFHSAAGGKSYTALSHRLLARMDLSSHIALGRAILVARTATPARRLLRDGNPIADIQKQWTYCRAVFPVASATTRTASSTSP